MIIRTLRANFGKLHGELSLHEGMNLLCLPNEAGKSTWSAFVLAMLYGIDTNERVSKANEGLPAKERYKPWDGSPMQGSMELCWNGREITIERTSAGRVPMGRFRAYETVGGAPVPELTDQNCGRLLCGVERSVFERTAFIRQLGLTVTEDNALEKRLGSLVTTGEEGAKSYSELKELLLARRNKLAGRVGRTVQLAAREAQLARTVRELAALQNDALALRAELEQAKAEQTRLEALLRRIDRAHAAQKSMDLQALEQSFAAQQKRCAALEQTAAALPEQEALYALQRRLEAAQDALQTAQMEAAFVPKQLQAPPAPPCFAGLDAAQALARAEQDAADYAALRAAPKKRVLPLLAASALVLALGIAAFFLPLLPAAIAASALGAAGLVAALLLRARESAKAGQREQRAQLILLRYSAASEQELCALAREYAAQCEAYETENERLLTQQSAAAQALAERRAQLDEQLAAVRAFAPGAQSPADCRAAIAAALQAHSALLSEQRALAQQQRQLEAMRRLLGQAQTLAPDDEALQLDAAKLAYERSAAERRVQSLSTQLAQNEGMLSVKGEAEVLHAQLEQTREQLAAAQQAVQVVTLCEQALAAADSALRARFSPQITSEAAQLLNELTEGKYRKLLLAPDMRLSVGEEGGVVLRSAAAMSCGTADQMYLALRLAMSRRLLPPDAPLLLDDALVNFDDRRAAAALKLLRSEAQQRQVILFTCRALEE